MKNIRASLEGLLDDFGILLEFIGTALLLISTAPAPNIGTDGGSLIFGGNPPYHFIIETGPQLVTLGIFSLMLGFMLQLLSRFVEKRSFLRWFSICIAIGIILGIARTFFN